jgi:hypothetical protein
MTQVHQAEIGAYRAASKSKAAATGAVEDQETKRQKAKLTAPQKQHVKKLLAGWVAHKHAALVNCRKRGIE